ncbi:MAG: insulinase family protein, partial [Hyphomicrobiales bacterium]|nr:insulinase family protein [Hyphomicrobiales bacterium]
AEVARAKAQMRAGLLMGLESPVACAGRAARQMLYFGRPIPVEETLARIDAITAERIAAIARGIFRDTRPTLAAVGGIDRLPALDEIAERLASGAVVGG